MCLVLNSSMKDSRWYAFLHTMLSIVVWVWLECGEPLQHPLEAADVDLTVCMYPVVCSLHGRYRELAPHLVPQDYTNNPDIKVPLTLIITMPELKVPFLQEIEYDKCAALTAQPVYKFCTPVHLLLCVCGGRRIHSETELWRRSLRMDRGTWASTTLSTCFLPSVKLHP